MQTVEPVTESLAMLVEFMRSGGFANVPLGCSVDTEALAPELGRALERQLEDADFFALPAKLGPGSAAADAFHYHVTVRTVSRSHTVDVVGGGAPDSMQDLLETLTRIAKTARRSSNLAHGGGRSD